MEKELIRVNNVYLKYNKKYILKDFNLTINEKDFFVILGANGSGKSTLIKTMVRSISPDAGNVLYKNKYINLPFKSTLHLKIFNLKLKNSINNLKLKIYKKNQNKLNDIIEDTNTNLKIIENHKFLISHWKEHQHIHSKKLGIELAYVPQLINFPEQTTVYEFVKLGRFPHSNLIGVNLDFEKEEKIIYDAMDKVGIRDLSNKLLNELSGGQKQKTLIAMALAQETATIILDEPTNHLDIKSQIEIMEILHELHHKFNKTIIMIIHDINFGIRYSNKIILMKDGKIVAHGKPKEIITKENILKTFGVDSTIIIDGQKIKVTDFNLPIEN